MQTLTQRQTYTRYIGDGIAQFTILYLFLQKLR